MSSTTYEFQVAMTCEGCAKAVRTLVGKVPGVEEVNIDVAKKQVLVKGTASSDALLAAIKKTGKETTLVSS
ncbi:copper chaperone Atox1, putative [Acanthamoeba castellanii str. Neff]|jgi:copper chaperone|uniref:Copper chaperone Atox1, putative n=1 Tax=Acanthamoeba castellanii (strain ATCC 30010 / Neff) TaxID=1257118 RepID=L8HHA3_ACACF|nr:copper chaperone Atox1, putative [Acanthamoeba castellanii str. Neff]ELR24063.1 copper chaperone Atox1, putative [Acanthamoeba castellanii str. Neff]